MSARAISRLALCLALCLGGRAAGQVAEPTSIVVRPTGGDSAAVDAFVDAARAGTARFRDQSVAVRAGFRRLGPDFPGMGEHWVNATRVFEATSDPARPAMLSYATIAGVPTLVGVVYVRALLAEERAPEWPVGREAWHDHTLTVDEEALALDHSPHAPADRPPARLALLHAWVWLDNPGGPFASDNWALPFARLGIAAPVEVSIGAARAASLISGGDRHLRWMIDRAASPDSLERTRLAARIDAYRGRVQAALASRAAGPLRMDERAALEALWAELWTDLEREVSAATAARLRESASALGAPPRP